MIDPSFSASSTETRRRLLEAAGEIFAEQGFRRATIRDIVSRAGANIAAVNYHFGDKQGLYVAVLQHGLTLALKKYPPDEGLSPGATPEQRLHAYVRSFLFRLLAEGAPAWHGKLMAQEMSEPTAAMDLLLSETIRPLHARLWGIVQDLLGPGATEEAVRLGCSSVAGQCCFYRHADAMLSRLYPDQKSGPEWIERLADHIVQFSLHGLRACAASANQKLVTA